MATLDPGGEVKKDAHRAHHWRKNNVNAPIKRIYTAEITLDSSI
jgi:hypothetical protein